MKGGRVFRTMGIKEGEKGLPMWSELSIDRKMIPLFPGDKI